MAGPISGRRCPGTSFLTRRWGPGTSSLAAIPIGSTAASIMRWVTTGMWSLGHRSCAVLPPAYRVVVIHGTVYYVADDVYYRPGPEGYVVVERPPEPAKVTVSVPEPQASTVTLYVPKKDDDGFIPVTLKKIDGGFLGPQGEFYPTMPRVGLLTEMYGIPDILRADVARHVLHPCAEQGRPDVHACRTDPAQQWFRRPAGRVLSYYAYGGPLGGDVRRLRALREDGRRRHPACPQEPAKTEEAAIHVQVHKKNGQGTVDVILKKSDQGYLGPQGEFYPEMPSPAQLADVYGAE